MIKLGDRGLNLLKKWEQGPKGGFSPVIYPCSAGKNTIGYGHVITPDDNIIPPITEKQADDLLKQDIKTAENAVNLLVKVSLTQNQFDALVCFVFNIGVGAFQKSTLLSFINKNIFNKVPDQFKLWNKITVNGIKKVSNGLTNRRQAEVTLFLSKN